MPHRKGKTDFEAHYLGESFGDHRGKRSSYCSTNAARPAAGQLSDQLIGALVYYSIVLPLYAWIVGRNAVRQVRRWSAHNRAQAEEPLGF
jgi:hypothetical protein